MNLETKKIFDNWEKLPVEEKKRRVKVRMGNAGKYKGTLIIKDPAALGMA